MKPLRFRALGSQSDIRTVALLYSLQTLVAGGLNVLIIVASLELLDLGRSGVGFLNSAVGAGGILGTVVALARLGQRRLATDFGVGLALFGLGLALVGVRPSTAVALVLLGVVGVGNTLVDVSAATLLQRGVSDEVLARVFGALESLLVATLGLGAVLAPPVIAAVKIRAALIIAGSVLPVSAALAWRELRRIDLRAAPPDPERLELLRSIAIFNALPEPSLEHLAAQLESVSVPANAVVVREGELGDRFYAVAEGVLAVTVEGEHRPPLEAGGFFGEIALLRDVPRTAIVVASTPARLYALARDEFVATVTGHAPTQETVDAVVAVRLGSLRSGVVSILDARRLHDHSARKDPEMSERPLA